MGTEFIRPKPAGNIPAYRQKFYNAIIVQDKIKKVLEYIITVAESIKKRYEKAANRYRANAGIFNPGNLV